MVKTRGWTKWGGGRLMLVKAHHSIWNCQACGEEQSIKSPAYMFPLGEDNYVRICSDCQSKVVHIHIETFIELKRTNEHGMWVDKLEEE